MEFVFAEGRLSDSPFIEKIYHVYSDTIGDFTSTAASQSEIVVTRYEGKTTITIRGRRQKLR